MDLSKLLTGKHKLLFSSDIHKEKLEVLEHNHLRWFTFGGNTVQSIVDTTQPCKIILPIPQSMLLFLLWKTGSIHILNLGMGAGSFERYFADSKEVEVTSVEKYPDVIQMAKDYFMLPEQHPVHTSSAEAYISNNMKQFDVILADIFFKQKSPDFIKQMSFYQHLQKGLSDKGIVMCNVSIENSQALLDVLHAIKQFFKHIALIEFTDYKNIVLVLSNTNIPNQQQLTTAKDKLKLTPTIDFSSYIEHLHYIPSKRQ